VRFFHFKLDSVVQALLTLLLLACERPSAAMSEEKRLPFAGYVTPSKSPKEGRVSARPSKLSTVRSCSSPNRLRAAHADKNLEQR